MTWLETKIPTWARKQGRPVSVGEIAAAFSIGHARALSLAMRLVNAGELIDNENGTLSARPDRRKEPEGPPPVQTRLWRAICFTQQPFKRRTVALLAASELSYTGDYFRFLERKGFIKAVYAQPGKPKLYRRTEAAPAVGQPPVWQSRRENK